jgi:hypothetical protein
VPALPRGNADINAYFQAHQKDGFMVLAVNAGDSQASAAAFAKTTIWPSRFCLIRIYVCWIAWGSTIFRPQLSSGEMAK